MPRAKKMTKTEMKKVFKPIILKEIEKIEKEVKMLSGESAGEEMTSVYSVHMADVSGEIYEKEFSAGILSKEYEALSALRYALDKIERGVYGICEGCGEPIPKGRLKIMPSAILCVKCEEERQKELNGKGKKIF